MENLIGGVRIDLIVSYYSKTDDLALVATSSAEVQRFQDLRRPSKI